MLHPGQRGRPYRGGCVEPGLGPEVGAGGIERTRSRRVSLFGRAAVDLAQERVFAKLEGWGYRSARTDQRMRAVTAQLLLVNRSARLEDLTDEALQHLHGDPRLGPRRGKFHAVHRAVAGLGFANPPAMPTRGRQMPVEGASADWMAWVDRWRARSGPSGSLGASTRVARPGSSGARRPTLRPPPR